MKVFTAPKLIAVTALVVAAFAATPLAQGAVYPPGPGVAPAAHSIIAI